MLNRQETHINLLETQAQAQLMDLADPEDLIANTREPYVHLQASQRLQGFQMERDTKRKLRTACLDEE